MKNKLGFILVKPQLGENIGAVARSMKNFGFKKLSVVSPKFTFPNHKTKVTSVGAYDIIQNTKIFNNIEKSIEEFDILISLSARERDINKKRISIADLHKILKKKKGFRFGFLFGPEASGLTNKEISYSNFVLQIPTSKKFKSLNLSHAVTIVCYEISKILNRKIFEKKEKSIKVSSKSKILSLVKFLVILLDKKNFFLPEQKRQSMILNINNLLYRLEPTDKELRVLASIISTLSKNKR